jgi:penicillin-binding protein 1A
MISDILSDNIARTPLWGNYSQVFFGERDVAVKSGSTNNSRDAWIMGYTPNLVVGVWVGNNDNAPMNGLSGLIATPMWRQFFDVALAKVENESFPEPPPPDPSLKPILRGAIMDPTFMLEQIQSGSSTLDIAGVTDNIHSILHFVDRSDPTGPYPTNPERDGQYEYWEYSVQKWKETTYGALIESVTEAEEEQEGEEEEPEPIPRSRRSR